MTRPQINGISPFFIAQSVPVSLSFYRDLLGFDVTFTEPKDDPFFAIVCRDKAMIMVKSVGVAPVANHTRDPSARWDAYLNVPDPDALAAEYLSRGIQFSEPLKDTHDGLRGFELKDADGYVLFFGRPQS
jgi:catechol 2,3-dioxygenase-like lactoylglutathione lyase family enzyme